MSVSWPSELPPIPLARGFSMDFANATRAFVPASGKTRYRPAANGAAQLLSLAFDLDATQADFWTTWWPETAENGNQLISFTHPVTGDPVSLQVTDRPRVVPITAFRHTLTFSAEIIT